MLLLLNHCWLPAPELHVRQLDIALQYIALTIQLVAMWTSSPSESVLKSVCMNNDVFIVCLQHALSTEEEEVMGLLIGEIDDKNAQISALMMLRRSDKRKDRVEISPEQLSGATEYAEKLTAQMERSMRVIGWYHSHPHITVWPSHVDVQTQFDYQMLDQGFVGVIFSVFSQDKSKEQEVQVTCFQSVQSDGKLERKDIDLYIRPTRSISASCLEWMVKLPKILVEEENDAHEKACKSSVHNILASIHNDAELTKALCRITELMSLPLNALLEVLSVNGQRKIQELERLKISLQQQLMS